MADLKEQVDLFQIEKCLATLIGIKRPLLFHPLLPGPGT